ncbi:hypothetical protein [Pseudoalteromonas sp. Ld20]|uniref:hypothetical protein n=1 Tax=Pseudoalteromonas sp. Ld20 TaxID=649165 RepID=UPI0038705B31
MEERTGAVALILGGHVNGYAIVKELNFHGVEEIVLFQKKRSLASFSNKVKKTYNITCTEASVLHALESMKSKYSKIILYPTDDAYLEVLHKIYSLISSYCYIPFNNEHLLEQLDKFHQYDVCSKSDIPYPKTLKVDSNVSLAKMVELKLPLIVKPSKRLDLTTSVFRAKYFETEEDIRNSFEELEGYLNSGVEFIASEFIPGDDTNIYAYTCFRSNDGELVSGWGGKKLTQYPDEFGVVSSASNTCPAVVIDQGRNLVEALNAFGIVEPEFKFDSRDGKYKLMETNLRSMMWHRVGFVSGVSLHYLMYLKALGKVYDTDFKVSNKKIHLVLMLHEIPNLIARKSYFKHFRYNVFGGEKREWAIYERGDLKPFFFSLLLLFKMSFSACLNRLKKKLNFF